MSSVQDKPWGRELWHISLLNFDAEVKDGINIADDIMSSHCTLRKGEQQAGVVFKPEQKIVLAKALDEIGIPELEVGTPSVSLGEQQAVKAISKAGLKAKILPITVKELFSP